jgi:hypothetical protein
MHKYSAIFQGQEAGNKKFYFFFFAAAAVESPLSLSNQLNREGGIFNPAFFLQKMHET